jgi:hypothetical protein
MSAILCAAVSPSFAQRGIETRSSKAAFLPDTGSRFGEVRAFSDGSGVLISWQMLAEKNNIGFNVHRTDHRGTLTISDAMVPGAGTASGNKAVSGERYTFFDPAGTSQSVYFVQAISTKEPVSVSQTVAVEYVQDISEVALAGADDLQRQAADLNANSKIESEALELPKTLAQEVTENRAAADDATHQWVVSQPGVRIGVRRDGIYRITKAELQAAGFNVNSDPSLWQLYRQGVQHSILMGPNGDYFDFYGKAIDTPESDTATYFLVAGPSAGKRIQTRSARPVAGSVTTKNYRTAFEQRQRTNYISDILNGEAENYWGAVLNTFADTTYNFTLTGVDLTGPNASVLLKFQGFSLDQHVVTVKLNGETLANASGNSTSPFSASYSVPASFLREGTNTLVLRAAGPNSVEASLFDSVTVTYNRRFVAAENKIRFFTSNYRLSKLEGFTSPNIKVFDMTNETAPVLWTNLNVIPEGNTYSVRMPSDRGRSMYATVESAYLSSPSITANDPQILRSASNAAKLVIIAYKDWMAEAENWANYRRNQGFTVKVIEVSEIFDEFNYGDLSSLSIRSFLNYAETNWSTNPDYVLLIGDASYDSRNYSGQGYRNYVPTKIVNTVFSETGSDDYLADFNGDGLADMAIGRVAARTGQAVTNALAKVTTFESASPTLAARGALFAYDSYDSDNNYDFQAMSVRIRDQLPGSTPTTMIGRSDTPPPPATPQTLLVASMNTGKFVVNYTGHGTTGAWVSSAFFANSTVSQLTNANNQSIFTMLTCLNGYFLHPTSNSLAETLVASTSGGAVASWASTGKTTPDVQEVMATRFFLKLGQGQITRLGDLVNDAKSVIAGGTDVRLSWALIGDPLLRVQSTGGGNTSAEGQ